MTLDYTHKEETKNFDINTTKLQFPLVTKPINEGHGNGVTVGINTKEELQYGIEKALKFGNALIIQEFIVGDEHRILVIGNQVILGIKRIPAFVLGNGCQNIKDLIIAENANPLRGEGYQGGLSQIQIDEELIHYIESRGYSLDSIPIKNEKVQLKGISNIGAGGILENVTEQLGDTLKNECVQIAQGVGLDVVGVDIVTTDLSQGLHETGGAVIEINANPGFGGDYEGTGINTAKKLLEYVFFEKK